MPMRKIGSNYFCLYYTYSIRVLMYYIQFIPIGIPNLLYMQKDRENMSVIVRERKYDGGNLWQWWCEWYENFRVNITFFAICLYYRQLYFVPRIPIRNGKKQKARKIQFAQITPRLFACQMYMVFAIRLCLSPDAFTPFRIIISPLFLALFLSHTHFFSSYQAFFPYTSCADTPRKKKTTSRVSFDVYLNNK